MSDLFYNQCKCSFIGTFIISGRLTEIANTISMSLGNHYTSDKNLSSEIQHHFIIKLLMESILTINSVSKG